MSPLLRLSVPSDARFKDAMSITKTILDVIVLHKRDGNFDLVHRSHLNFRQDVVFGSEVGVTHTRKENVDADIVRPKIAPLKSKRRQSSTTGLRRISICCAHSYIANW